LIFIFNGPPGSGKDAASLYFQSLGFIHLSFKEELFKETIEYFDVKESWFMEGYNDRTKKEVKELLLGDMSRREAMIFVSERVIKPNYGKDYFGVKTASKILPNHDYCFSDGGFVEELFPIINKTSADQITLIQLTRDGCDFSSDSRRYFDGDLVEQIILEKETPISKIHILPQRFPIRMYRIHNNGTIEQFEKALHSVYEKEKNEKEGAKPSDFSGKPL
jgi:hypothetical protein